MSDDRPKVLARLPMGDINITPLIDVMLVLLIIFMVVTPVASRGLDASLPQPAPDRQAPPPPPSLLLTIDETGLALNHEPLASVGDMTARLRDVLQTRADHTLFVRATPGVSYGRVVEALDAARDAGIDRLGLVTRDSPAPR